MSQVYDYYKMMNEDNIMLAFKGGVTSDLLTSLLQVAENKLETVEATPKVKKKIFNILGDTVETVTPWLVDNVLKTDKNGARVAWLTGGKAFRRFMTAGFNKRDLFAGV